MLIVGDKVRLADGLKVGNLCDDVTIRRSMVFTGSMKIVKLWEGGSYELQNGYMYSPSMLVKVEETSFNVTDLPITKVVTPAKTKLRETSILFCPRTDTNPVTVKFINNGVEKTEKFDGDMSNALYEVREMILKEETSDFIKETVKACFANPTWKEQEL